MGDHEIWFDSDTRGLKLHCVCVAEGGRRKRVKRVVISGEELARSAASLTNHLRSPHLLPLPPHPAWRGIWHKRRVQGSACIASLSREEAGQGQKDVEQKGPFGDSLTATNQPTDGLFAGWGPAQSP